MDITCRLCLEPCDFNDRLVDRNFREMAQDILVLHLKIDRNHIAIVCCSCQSQVESFYLFKQKCRQNEKMRQNPKVTESSEEFVVKEMDVIPPNSPEKLPSVKNPVHPNPPAKTRIQKEPHASNSAQQPCPIKLESTQNPTKKKGPFNYQKDFYQKRNGSLFVPLTEEQLATKSREQLYKERQQRCCEICGKTVSNPCYLIEHMNKHLGIRPFACNVPECGATFCGSTPLKQHTVRRHSNGHYPCPKCDSVFTNETALRTHGKIHKERRYFCEICNLGCYVKSALKKHMLIHTQQRDHKCEHCGKAFYAKTVLTLHLRSHTGERPYVCHVCGVANAHRILYVKHMQKFHPAEEIRMLAEMQRLAKAEGKNK